MTYNRSTIELVICNQSIIAYMCSCSAQYMQNWPLIPGLNHIYSNRTVLNTLYDQVIISSPQYCFLLLLQFD